MNIKNSKILVTGGSSGIGKAIAKLAIEKGAEVLITGRDKDKLKSVAYEIGASHLLADVAKEKDIEATFDWIKTNWNRELDVLINLSLIHI